MIISPYYQHLSAQCELRILYRLYGDQNAALMVTSQHRALSDSTIYADSYDYDDETEWTRPTLHSTFKAQNNNVETWKEANVHIGQISHPTRIRIECHSRASSTNGPSKENTECYIDDISMIKCEEEIWYENVCQSNKTKKYLCHKYEHRKCIDYDQICDMSADCPGAEDEQTNLHNCTSVPVGARCTFEDLSEAKSGCAGWRLETYYVHNSRKVDNDEHLFQLVNSALASKKFSSNHIPLRDHTFLHTNDSGHFLYFTSEDNQERYSFTDTKSTYLISPYFPPTSSILLNSVYPLASTCKVRFYYCSYGSAISTLQLTVHSTSDQPAKIIWTPPSITFADQHHHCEWIKVSIDLPEQKSDYYLKISVSKIFDSSVSFAIDDFSMSPDCFTTGDSWRTHFIPYVYNITSCGQYGASQPTSDLCESYYNQSTTKAILKNSTSSGFQKWMAPKTAEYRFEVYGASGGQIPRQTVNNYGGHVIMIVNLTIATELDILVGQMGETPCSQLKVYPNYLKSHQYEALKYLCKKSDTLWNDDTARTHGVMFPGTGGGGATIIKNNGKIMVVAGGGGGIFPEQVIELEKPNIDPKGGNPLKGNKNQNLSHIYPFVSQKPDVIWMSGNGASLFPTKKKEEKCENCNDMSGRLTNNSSSGGVCSALSAWKVAGGYGGGGASCGPGGGGGAGYEGGEGGQKYHGIGGKSFALDKNAIIVPGINIGNGYVLIYPCRLQCSANATCRFRSNNINDISMFCACPNGRAVGELEDCIFGIYFRRRLEKTKLEKAVLNREIGLCALEPTTPVNISGNPIYESFGVCAELQHIPRAHVNLIRPLGQGAFGEVFEGSLNFGNEIIQVAVKTLPKSASKQALNDFEMEALIMSKFRHENICELMGVCFDITPRLIILELLSGGDLKSFLRECRPKTLKDQRIQMVDLLNMARDVAKGCKFLADNRFIHRDIAARNCLLTKKDTGRIVKIADFGMARDIYRQDYYRKGGRAMLPVKWMPPEAFLDGIFTVKTDVWSFGVLMWEIFSLGYMPYPGRNNQEVMSLIVNGGRLEPPNGLPDQIYALMLNCWNTADTDRPHFDVIIDALDAMLQNPIMQRMPSPVIIHRLSQSQSFTTCRDSESSDNPISANETISQNAYSRSTMNTMLNSYSEHAAASSCDPLPTKENGINFNICTPYQPQSSEPFCIQDRLPLQSSGTAGWINDQLPSGSSETCSVGSYGCMKKATEGQVLSRKTLQEAAAGSRRPVIDTDFCDNQSNESDYANAIRTEAMSLLEKRYPLPQVAHRLPISPIADKFEPSDAIDSVRSSNSLIDQSVHQNYMNQSQIL
ncbi:unnamed protein product [Thelazia callipaeda]|uniref:Tyrosine-protein kinase receptor n=1 Tax=Thelazia callipaeda TaxID=103827 RepID=A0A0N5CPP5_THECL|nr:unnamed protein product [Thelazia callipaeda]